MPLIFIPSDRDSYFFLAHPAVAAEPATQQLAIWLAKTTKWKRALLYADLAYNRAADPIVIKPGVAKLVDMLQSEGVKVGLHVLPAYCRVGALGLYPYRRLDQNFDPIPAWSGDSGWQLTDEGIAIYCAILAQIYKQLGLVWSYCDGMEEVATQIEWITDPIAGQIREVWMAHTWLNAVAAAGGTSLFLEGSSPRDLELPARASSPVLGGATDYDLDNFTFLQELQRNLEKFGTTLTPGYADTMGTVGWIPAWRQVPPANPVTLADFQAACDACVEHKLAMSVFCWPNGAPVDIDSWAAAMEEMEAARLGAGTESEVLVPDQNLTHRRTRPQTLVYWPLQEQTFDAYGKPQLTAPIEIKGRWEDRAEEFIDSRDTCRTSRAVVYPDRDLEVGGKLMLGRISELDEEHTPIPNRAWEILAVEKSSTLRGRRQFRKALL